MGDVPISGLATGFEEYDDKQLINYSSSDIRDGDRLVAESNRRLRESIDTFNKKTSEQTSWIIKLTIAMLIVGFAQIGLLLYSLLTQG